MKDSVFPALLKHWRNSRGLSQLDLSLAADVSARHISFLETGRSKPSENMVLQLASTLDIPLRDRNTLLSSAGFEPRYRNASPAELMEGVVGKALQAIKRAHEPYPLTVLDRLYNVVDMNGGAQNMFSMLAVTETNVLRAMFSENLRPFIENWEQCARVALERLHGEVLARPHDDELAELFRELTSIIGLKTEDVAIGFDEPAVVFRFVLGDSKLEFLTTLTTFNAPQNVALDELVIESYFPTNDETRAFFANL